MPDKNTLGRQRLPPEKQLLCDWYTNTVHSYHSEERREGGAGWAKGLKEKDGEREGEEGNETGGDKPVPLYEKKSQSMTRNLPSGTQTFWFALRAFAGWTRQYVNAVFNCTHRKKECVIYCLKAPAMHAMQDLLFCTYRRFMCEGNLF